MKAKTASRLQRQWRSAASRLGLRVRIPFVLPLPDGTELKADALVEGFGAARGMLIFSNYNRVREYREIVVSMGYGYSCMSQPTEAEIESLETIRAALTDWGRADQ